MDQGWRKCIAWIAGTPGLIAWSALVLAGSGLLLRYQMTPGAMADTTSAQNWPKLSTVSRDSARPTLVMMLHPKCPCSRASVHELEQLMSRARGKLAANVVFIQPQGAPAGWLDGDLWKSASAIPGVTVAVDQNGVDASRLGATTSGQVNLYDAKGKLLFAGGITDGRGHEGDNAGLDAVMALVNGQTATVKATPVYGCPLGTQGVCKVGAN